MFGTKYLIDNLYLYFTNFLLFIPPLEINENKYVFVRTCNCLGTF